MKTLRRHSWTITCVSAVVVLTGAFWLRGARDSTVLAQPQDPPTPLTQRQHDAIRGVLQKISLDRDALVALNPTAQQAESVLATTRTWWETNEATLQARKVSIDNAIHAVRQIERAIAMGPYEAGRDETLAIARQEAASARSAYASTLAPLKTSITALLSESQRATWQAILTGHGQAMPFRMLDLTDEQRLALSRAKRHFKWERAAASTQVERQAARSAYQTTTAQILTDEQENVIAAHHSSYDDASAAVAGATDTVLAREDEG